MLVAQAKYAMEHFLDKIKENYPELKIVDTSEGIELVESHEGINPHIWLSVDNAMKQVSTINRAISLKNNGKGKYLQCFDYKMIFISN